MRSRNRRGSQVVRSRSAKPLFAGSIPAPALALCSDLMDNGGVTSQAGSIDSVAVATSPSWANVDVARLPPAPFPPPRPKEFHGRHGGVKKNGNLTCYTLV